MMLKAGFTFEQVLVEFWSSEIDVTSCKIENVRDTCRLDQLSVLEKSERHIINIYLQTEVV